MKCEFGCGQDAKFFLKNGKACCSEFSSQCNVIKKKNSESLKKAHRQGKLTTNHITFKIRSKAGLKGAKNKWEKKFKQDLEDYKNKNYDNLCDKSKAVRDIYRRFILKEQQFKCNKCKIDNWNKKNIVLELHHIDGNKYNNQRNNLEFLCPNCHSQTNTWKTKGGVNKYKNNISFII